MCVSVGLVLGSRELYHISRVGTWTVVECVVSVGLVLGSRELYHISRIGTWTVVECVVSVVMVHRQW